MHGLIFETSVCYWQNQPGCYLVLKSLSVILGISQDDEEFFISQKSQFIWNFSQWKGARSVSTQLLSCQVFTIATRRCHGPLYISVVATDRMRSFVTWEVFRRRRNTSVAMSGTNVAFRNSSSVSRCRLQTIAVQFVARCFFYFQRTGNISTTYSNLHTSTPLRACCGIPRRNRIGCSHISEKFAAEKSVRSSTARYHCQHSRLQADMFRIIRFFSNFSWPPKILGWCCTTSTTARSCLTPISNRNNATCSLYLTYPCYFVKIWI